MAKASKLDGRLVTLIGGSGFLGDHLAQDLLARGARLRIACRHPQRAYHLRPLANLGQIQFVPCDVTKPDTVAAAVAGASAVAYLAGTFSGNIAGIQETGAGSAAAAARAAGAESFAYVSAIGVDPASEIAYSRSKARGEELVLGAFPKATILRPSVLFGEDDNFINLFAQLIAAFPVVPVFGPGAQLQPLFVDDCAAAIANALERPAQYGGKTFELGGPEVLTMLQFMRMIAAAARRDPLLLEMPDAASALFAAMPLTPMSRDQWKLLKAGNVASGTLPGITALGVSPRPLALFLDRWLVRYRKHGRFAEPAAG